MRSAPILLALLALVAPVHAAPCAAPSAKYPPASFRVVREKSGPVSYYRVLEESGTALLRSAYRPPLETVVMGIAVPSADRGRAARLAWSWRARTLPRGGDECAEGKGDSAAVVYVTWKRGLRWYTLKYVWSAVGTKGRVCDRKRNPFVAQDTIILESGVPLGTWKHVEIDLRAEFRRHFEDGDVTAEVPDLAGIGVMSDGDQTRSESAADFANFTLTTDAACKR